MYRRLVVPLDGSPLSEQALVLALALAKRFASELHIVHVRAMTPPAEHTEVEDPAREFIQRVASEATADLGRPVSYALFPEEPPDLLLPTPGPTQVANRIAEYVSEKNADLVVLATHGRGGFSRLWFGSTAEALIRVSPAPLLLVRPAEGGATDGWRGSGPLRRVLVPLDWTEASRIALEPAADLARTFGATLLLLRIVPTPVVSHDPMMGVPLGPPIASLEAVRQDAHARLEAIAEPLRASGCDVRTAALLHSSPPRAILDYVREQNAELIVLATRARRGLDRVLLGSVADKVVRGTPVPVLLLRQPAQPVED